MDANGTDINLAKSSIDLSGYTPKADYDNLAQKYNSLDADFSAYKESTKDYASIKEKYNGLLKENETKYVNKYELTRILDVYNSIPFQLAKENKKFQYNQIKTGARSKDYQDTINFLCDLGLAKKAYNLTSLESPLSAYKIDSEFKIYMFDTGLLVSMMDDYTAKDILEGSLGIYKIAIFENIIADILSKNEIYLYYYHKNNSLELDFVIRYKNEILPLEIKASCGNTKRLKTILSNKERYKINYGIKLTKQNIGFTNNILTIPYYLISFLKFNKE